jgi:hypothetical protein
MMFGRATLGLLCAICLSAGANAAALLEETLRNGHVVLHLTGRIVSRDAALFDAAVGKLTAAGKRIAVVSLNSTGGQLGEGALIAGVIKALRLATRVEDGAMCASACFLLFAAGEPRTAHPNSFIGVHKAADNDGRETYKSREATRAMVEFARQLGVSSTILDKMGRTPSDGVEWLSARDLRSMGVTVSNKYQPSNEVDQSSGEAQPPSKRASDAAP